MSAWLSAFETSTFNSFPVAASHRRTNADRHTPVCLSILSQLLREGHQRRLAREPLFQFFPSCCAVEEREFYRVRRFSTFNSFPVAANSGCKKPVHVVPHGLDTFNSFPVAARRCTRPPPSRAVPSFQFFPSCCSTGPPTSTSSGTYSFNSFPVAAVSPVDSARPRSIAFNSFPVAAEKVVKGTARVIHLRLLSILSQLLPRLSLAAPL